MQPFLIAIRKQFMKSADEKKSAEQKTPKHL